MYRSSTNFRRFSLRGLLIAGAVTGLGLPLAQEAYGIGGSAIQPTYTPRESVGAAPSVSLISTGASSSSAAAVASSGVGGAAETNSQSPTMAGGAHVSSDNEGHGTTKKRKKKAQETGGTRVAKGTTYEAKESKESPPPKLVAPPSKPIITLSTGFESRYIYHGVDIVGFNSSGVPNGVTLPATAGGTVTFTQKEAQILNNFEKVPTANATSPVLYLNGSTEFKGFQLGVGYIYAIDPTIPSRDAIENTATAFTRFFNQIGFPTPFGSYNNTKEHYQEVDLNLDYTLSIIANVLDATVGYNSYIIPDHAYKGTNYQGEAFVRITYKQIPYIQPSVTYYRYISDARAIRVGTVGLYDYEHDLANSFAFTAQKGGEYLNGNYIEARLDGAYPLIKGEQFSAGFSAYGLISANDGYLTKQVTGTTNLEFNTAEVGAKIPMTVGGHFSITPYINYGFDISPNHDANDFSGKLGPFKEDVWGGITFSYRF
jgi:hypothetical protein